MHKAAEICVVMLGDPMNGYALFGPFDSYDRAEEWIDAADVPVSSWWIMPLRMPVMAELMGFADSPIIRSLTSR
ncbi:hypothetical protein [Glaciimonas sp. PCH181]|uniref:hypothetical protein n=1 Tax=Glaciimonas sp. PCH181 TaxID=2133943 RepID=UPI000D33572C|nr:hypothetical protein [Glaciimonas sp. PCH181]PUA19451.1 hypothetical protein C7W93_06185 [Glaciimonas sp. PCH181]